MDNIIVSVIVPIYNVEKYLHQCVDSILSQTYKNIEVILVDDGSPDKCPQICDEYAQKDSRVKVIHKKNGGLGDARNVGLENATGEYVMFIDSDDYYIDKNVIQKLMNTFTDCVENIDFITFDCFWFLNIENVLTSSGDHYNIKNINNNKKEYKICKLIKCGLFPASSCMKIIKRNFLLSNNIVFPTKTISEDIPWFIDVLRLCRDFMCLPDKYYIYRKQSESSITSSFSLKKYNDLFDVIEMCISKVKNDMNVELNQYLLSYMAYEYCILLSGLSRLDNDIKAVYYKRIQKNKWILKYDLNPKVKKVKLLLSLFGINLTSLILAKYVDKRMKKITNI